ncbi:MAG: hypothetical protein ACHQ6T_05125 [Myxococcota bacterium]
MLLLAGLERAGVDLVAAGRAQSALSGAACVVLAALLTRRLLPRAPLTAGVTALVVAANPYVAAWGGAGLETTLFAALALAAALPLSGRAVDRRAFVTASALALLLALTRPEGVAVYAALALAVFFSLEGDLRRRIGVLAPGAALFGLLGGAYFAWRVSYFGDWLPNTFYAKSGFTAAHALRGAGYLLGFAANPFVWLELPLVLVGAVSAWRTRERAVAASAAALLAAVVAVGGDGLPMYRFLVPAIPLLAVLAALGASALASGLRSRGAQSATPVAALVGVLALSLLPLHDAQYALMVEQRDYEIPTWRAVGETLGRALPRDALVAAVPIGALGWYSDLRILDMVGLTDRAIAHAPVATGSGWAGHEKHDGRYVLSRRPDAILLGNIFVADASHVPLHLFPTFTNPYIAAREGDVPVQPEFARDYVQGALRMPSGSTLHFALRRDVAQLLAPAQ